MVLVQLLREHSVDALQEDLLQSEVDIVFVVGYQQDEHLGPVCVEIVVFELVEDLFAHLLHLVETVITNKAKSIHRVVALHLKLLLDLQG